MVGKLPPSLLKKYIFSRIGVLDPNVIVGSSIGEDSAVIDLGDDKVLIAHVDPISGAVEYLGWLAVHIASNDIAVSGARPRWLLSVLYLPTNADNTLIDRITKQIDSAAKELNAMIIGGHSEFTPGLDRPLISMTALGITTKDKYVRTGGARVGDVVIMTKTAAIEGTAILSTDFKSELINRGVSVDILNRGRNYIKSVSVVREALALADMKLANSMHDPTEGGILGGLTEIAYASGTTIEVWEDRIPIARETAIVCNTLNVDVLRLISSGVLIATIPEDKVKTALNILERVGVKASVIGKVIEYDGNLVILHRVSGITERYNDVLVEDELFRLWREYKS